MTDVEPSPSFDRPPVSQVSLGVDFDRLPKARSAHFGLLWGAIGGRGTYSDVEDLFRVDVEPEMEDSNHDRPQIDLEFTGRPRGTRTRFSNSTSRVDIQDDALTAAWYGEPCSGDYPRYDTVRARFALVLEAWRHVVAESELGELRSLQTEVRYRNHILAGHGWERVDDLRTVLNVGWLPTLEALPTEDVHVYQRHVLRGGDDGFRGRLYMSVDSARQYHGAKCLDFSLTVRQRFGGDTDEALLADLDAAHDLIVHSFTHATSERMHGLWGRRS